CLKLIDEALKLKLPTPAAARKNAEATVAVLHAVAVETALADLKDGARIEKATPHIKELIACPYPRSQRLGHLFQGAIELEQSGAGRGTNVAATAEADATAPVRPEDLEDRGLTAAQQAKFRASALNHLKIAATQLPDVAEAQ